ncbi:hypothetical protein [Melghirimyces algeriensis]|uniref:Uncharacterized protein n=1 Tax=Melghirimyces algeriensis TaxID=910412 RepID=A0A521BZP2_9BACL|nr:hypothetical protein [Melghirimyces algeriensis]SMO52672.1 hypothetical protein SAMN06264849_10332 [Melghirimyces algeriensis]
MNVVPSDQLPKRKVTDFFITHWGSPRMVLSRGVFPCDELDG